MDELAELRTVEELCRLCLSTEEPRASVFELRDSSLPLAAKIQACLSIQISKTDKLSTLICAECVAKVNRWHDYKEACLRSQDKLRQWLAERPQSSPAVVTVKGEPVDLDFYEDAVEVRPESPDHSELQQSMDTERPSADESSRNRHIEDEQNVDSARNKYPDEKRGQLLEIKTEPRDDYDCDYETDCTVEIESATGSELLPSPSLEATQVNDDHGDDEDEDDHDDTVMEADSTQKPANTSSSSAKRKVRRGPHTHFRGTRVFKQKCAHCRINLHSKHSYAKHMERFHSREPSKEYRPKRDSVDKSWNKKNAEGETTEEMVEDLEEELASMEMDAPLTQVQQSIISQLKTFSCYSCEQNFTDRRSTLSHIRQHMPDLRPYTCIACLTEFPDRAMYKLHCGASFECAMKIALVVPKRGDERYFTCNMCLRPMHSRKELLRHLSKHSDRQYEEMMAPSVRSSPPKLKPMAPLPSVSSAKGETFRRTSSIVIPGPYKNGDPAHNHVCELCGMIYRYKPNMLKHRELCLRLLPEARTSYRCVHCGMTFLVFKKFHSHITVEHKKKEFSCPECNAKFRSPSDYLAHHESHRAQRQHEESRHEAGQGAGDASDSWDSSFTPEPINSGKIVLPVTGSQKYSCALCGQELASKAELTEHRNLHLKVKIYSCVICRSMFSSAGALEIHMKDHGIEDPKERTANSSCVEYARIEDDSGEGNSSSETPASRKNECVACGKLFSNYANLRRHIRNIHKQEKRTVRPAYTTDWPNADDSRNGTLAGQQHQQLDQKSPRTRLECPRCPESFVFRANLRLHYRTAHGDKSRTKQECNICGKCFLGEASLKIHKGWHNRANSHLSVGRFALNNNRKMPLSTTGRETVIKQEASSPDPRSPSKNPERQARARKSFPNPPPAKPPVTEARTDEAATLKSNFQCQVCDDRFSDVLELRKHLWDVHCAKNKPEKSFSGDELQCELCTNVFPDRETLKVHLQWHRANPILGDAGRGSFPCDICGKLYSSRKVLWKHKKLHKATTGVASANLQSLARKPISQYLCTVCRKTFSSNQSLQRHKLSFHGEVGGRQQHGGQQRIDRQQNFESDDSRAKRVKLEPEEEGSSRPSFLGNLATLSTAPISTTGKKPVMCHVCKKVFPNMSVLYKHKQLAHRARKLPGKEPPVNECVPLLSEDGKFSCNLCDKRFAALAYLRQHFSIKHKNTPKYTCQNQACGMTFFSAVTLKNHELTHTSMIFSCKLCDRHVFSRPAMSKHMLTVHNTVYEAETIKSFYRETDLSSYVVEGAVGATCPRCKIKYPNNKAMKIHYFKFHETADSA